MRASVCVGNYATTPYSVAGLDIPVYSMEELCYCIKENAFLLDVSLMSDALLEWIGSQCGLEELVKELYPLVHKQGSLSAFVTMIMEYTGFYATAVIRDVQQVLKQGAGLSNIEKRKSQIDYLVTKKKYVAALRGYDSLLAGWKEPGTQGQDEKMPAIDVKAAIIYNKGVAFTGMMLYGQAAEAFYEAYELDKREDYYMAFLAAKRMELSEGEYISFAAGLTDYYSYPLLLEKKMEELQSDWTDTVEYKRVEQRRAWRGGREFQKYCDENDRITQALKDSYRSNVAD